MYGINCQVNGLTVKERSKWLAAKMQFCFIESFWYDFIVILFWIHLVWVPLTQTLYTILVKCFFFLKHDLFMKTPMWCCTCQTWCLLVCCLLALDCVSVNIATLYFPSVNITTLYFSSEIYGMICECLWNELGTGLWGIHCTKQQGTCNSKWQFVEQCT